MDCDGGGRETVREKGKQMDRERVYSRVPASQLKQDASATGR